MKALSTTALLLFLLTGMSAAGAELRIALLDLSGSVGEGDRSPMAANMAALERYVRSTPKGTTIQVFGFGRRSFVRVLRVETPKLAGPGNRNLQATLEMAVRKLRENLASRRAEIDAAGTDIEGALYRAGRVFAEENEGGESTLFLFSDMQQTEGFTLDLKKLASQPLASLPRRFPDLRKIKVHVYSNFSDPKGLQTSAVERGVMTLKDFWKRYFERAGATLVEYRTQY